MILAIAAAAMAATATGNQTALTTRVCTKYSSILLEEGEMAEVNGAGQYSLSLYIKSPRGNWIFFDLMAEPTETDREGALVLTGPEKSAYRRSFDARIYSVQPTQPQLVDGKMVKTAVMGVDIMRVPLDNPAIVGDKSDLAVIERILPGEIGQCDLRFVAGKGLVRQSEEQME